MLTRLRFRNFKQFGEVDIPLAQAVVLIGPNNSGKTTALQALALWDVGLRRWQERRGAKGTSPAKRPGITINRRDLFTIPVPSANLLWRDLHVRDVRPAAVKGKSVTSNVRIDIIVDGVTASEAWTCGFEFDYANEESFYCRPLRLDAEGHDRMPVPEQAGGLPVAFLPPMSGLSDREYFKQAGEIGVLIGQGQTAQVLRNLCFQVYAGLDPVTGAPRVAPEWTALVEQMRALFGITLLEPQFIPERSEITMHYRDLAGNRLDLASSGRGLQQTLLLLAHLYANPGSLLLLDEPDAHLEMLRQRQIYTLLIEVAERRGAQIIAASHSEVVLNEAAGRDMVIAFVGPPHQIDDRGSQLLKALRDIGCDQYYQAEATGWVLYLEDSTDLAILQTFARRLEHPAAAYLERPFVKYLQNNVPQPAREHFFGLREAKPDLVGIALFDHLDKELQQGPLTELMWTKREIENYFTVPQVLEAYAAYDGQADNLFSVSDRDRRLTTMRAAIHDLTQALETLSRPGPWSAQIKATDDFLDPLFKAYYRKLNLPLQLRKSSYHVLAGLLPVEQYDPEIAHKLDAIVEVAQRARVGRYVP